MKPFKVNGATITASKCKKSDYPFILSIIKNYIFPFVSKYHVPDESMFRERFCKDYHERVILSKGKARIGYYQIAPQGNALYVTGIFFLKKYQSRGFGRFFMKYFESLGYKRIRLHVWDNNPAYKFYKKMGYKSIEKKRHKYLMEKKLA